MGKELDGFEIRSINECTISEITELWNKGFQQYFSDMTRTSMQTVQHLGNKSIRPDLSVAAFHQGVPAGFVFVGWQNVYGRKLAWNGGTGVNPAFRGQGLSTRLLREVIERLYEEGAESFSLETRTDNTSAIRAYERCGFRIIDRLPVMRRKGAFGHIPFPRGVNVDYRAIIDVPEVTGRLPFYRYHSSWTTQWFNSEGSQALLVYDGKGEICGYAIFRKSWDAAGNVTQVQLTHCEADPNREDAREIVRYILGETMGPPDMDLMRKVHYLPAGSLHAVEALKEEGFETTFEEYLMILRLEG